MKRLPIGISDFKNLIENDYLFADTTNMIEEVYHETAKIILITRPRRFGKTLNMSMLSYFFDNTQQTSHLFKGFDIAHDSMVMKEINAYPTIFITFKDIKNSNWEDCLLNTKMMLSNLYKEKETFLKNVLADKDERKYYRSIIERTATEVDYQNSLKKLINYLEREYNKKVLLIIDEYDIPIQSGWTHGYYDDVIDFMRVFLSAALKDNSNLFKGILTGIYRVAKESIFSGLNNLKVFTVLNERYSNYFGFTEGTLEKILETLNMNDNKEIKNGLKEWYNGYRFGKHIIYNPWSVINYLYDKELKPYWINTSSNDLIINLIEKNMKGNEIFREEIETLISGGELKKTIDDATSLREIERNLNSIWTLFLFSGYIKPEEIKLEKGKYKCKIKVPNEEVMIFFQDTVSEWLERHDYNRLEDMTQHLVKGNGEAFCENLKAYVMGTLSYYDIEKKSENTYHILLLGMFSHLQGDYWIKSNRESGKGRYDVLLKAKDKNHYSAIIEIKAETTQKKIEEGLEQIERNEYIQELKSEGYTKILKVALGVDGKDVQTLVRK
jgi:hypothetical protein